MRELHGPDTVSHGAVSECCVPDTHDIALVLECTLTDALLQEFNCR